MKAIHLAHQMLGSSCVPNVDKPQRPPLRLHGYDLAGGESGSPEQAVKFDHMVVMDPDLEWDAQIEIGKDGPHSRHCGDSLPGWLVSTRASHHCQSDSSNDSPRKPKLRERRHGRSAAVSRSTAGRISSCGPRPLGRAPTLARPLNLARGPLLSGGRETRTNEELPLASWQERIGKGFFSNDSFTAGSEFIPA